MAVIVGIDLGTTNSLVAAMRGDRPEILPNAEGRRLTPSVVGLDKQGRLHVGDTAKNQLVAAPDRTVAEVKRLMGSSRTVRLGDRPYAPQEVSALILRRLRDDAARHLGQPVDHAVITVPAYFTDAQRQATRDAGELAGLRVERILNEPTAAALAYGLDHLDEEQYVVVYDLGGGTFDVSVLEMFEGVLDVKASAGNNCLGGLDFDHRVADFLVKQFERDHGAFAAAQLRRDPRALARLKAAAEQAKHDVSTRESTAILLPFLATAAGQPLSLECEFSREQFELLADDLIRSTLDPIDQALRDARLRPEQIHEVVLVGGSSRIPLVQRLLAEKFGREPRRDVHPDEAIALGAAVQAGLLRPAAPAGNRGIMITDVSPFTLGVEVVAQSGAERVSGMFSPIIPRNSTIPISRTETYSTTVDGQTHVDIKVYQGESKLVRDNSFLDAYTIDGIPPGPAGSERIHVTFTYDVNGILQVRTTVLSTGREATLRIERSAARMSDGERHAARDRIEREWTHHLPPAADRHASVRALVAAAERRAAELTGAPRARVEDLVARLKRAVARDDAAETARLDEELSDALFDLA